MMIKRTLLSLAITSVLASFHSGAVQAATGDPLPHQFHAGSKAKAVEVNANFQSLADRIATVAEQAGSPAAVYQYSDFMPRGDVVKLFSPMLGGGAQELSLSYEWLQEGERDRLHVTENMVSIDGDRSHLLKVMEANDSDGLRLLEKRSYEIYGDGNQYLEKSIEWQEPLDILRPQFVKGQSWVVNGRCSSTNRDGVSENCYGISKRTVMGLEDVVTPAGTFSGCLKILLERTTGMDIYWLAPGMGRVKWVTSDQVIDGSEISMKKRGWLLSSYETQGSNLVAQSGSVLLAPEFPDNDTVAKVEYYRDAVSAANLMATQDGGNFNHQISYSASDNGDHHYIIQAYNALGEVVTTLQRTIQVAIDGDQQAPTLSLVATPTTVSSSGSITLTASSTDSDVVKVELMDGNDVVATDLTSPFSFKMDYDALDAGSYTYGAVATDYSGNRSSTATVSVATAMSSPNSAATAVNKAKALINELRAMATGNEAQGIGQLANPVDIFSQEITLAEGAVAAMTDHQTANMGQVITILTNHYLGNSPAEISEVNGSYIYDLTRSGGAGTGTLTITTANGTTQYHWVGDVNQDVADLILSLPEYNSVVGPYFTAEISGWVGQSSSADRLKASGMVLLELRQRILLNDQSYIPSGSADLYLAGIELEMDADVNYQRTGQSDLNFQGTVYIAGVMDLISELYASWYNSYNQQWSYYYGMDDDPLPTAIALDGVVSDGANRLEFDAEAQLSGSPAYPPQTGVIKRDLARYEFSTDGTTLTITFENGQTMILTYHASENKIVLSGELGQYPFVAHGTSVELRTYGSGYSDMLAVLGSLNSADLDQLDRQIYIDQEGSYRFEVSSNQLAALSRAGGTLHGTMEAPTTYNDPDKGRLERIALSFGGKLGSLPEGRVSLDLARVDREHNHFSLSATIAYDTVATEITAQAANVDGSSERLLQPVTIRSQDGVILKLSENESYQISGTLSLNGATVGTVSEVNGVPSISYSDNSSELF